MKSVAELVEVQEKFSKGMFIRNDHHKGVKVVVSMGECGIAAGARDVLAAITQEVGKAGLEVQVSLSDCRGDCANEPMFEVLAPGKDKAIYTKVTPQKAGEIIRGLA
ncbi:MAG: (2Fe-2S) ferredoxin domain-containing protein [Oscillospiraceae bacterium]|nr:(2Fe-2S) ferredoxin domain-containing protein [Oscillospiraceae bacterium]